LSLTVPSVRSGEGFAKSSRIRKRREFLTLQRRGRRRHTTNFIVIVSSRNATPEPPTSRLGVTVSRTVGNAVVRNRVKRAVREFFRRAHVAPGIDLVVIAKPGAGDLTSAALGAELAGAIGV